MSTVHLATFLREKGIDCAEAYPHFEYAHLIGLPRYQHITNGHDGLLGEMLFAEDLHGEIRETNAEERLSKLFGPREKRTLVMRELERRWQRRLDAEKPELIGLTTSCNQLMPALWFARIAKRWSPDVKVVLGGAACGEPMGHRIREAYPEVDFIVSGYGEWPLLAILNGDAPPSGIVQGGTEIDLDTMPIPDYAPFLRQSKKLSWLPHLMFESSRGCWWGEKTPCAFCGLNGQNRPFRKKSSVRVLHEIRTLWERHGRPLMAADTIMAREFLSEVVPALASFETKPQLFYEIKANLTEPELITLARAGIVGIQPGIESLSSRLLSRMRKGTRAIRNLALLKWCREQRVAVGWNQLYRIPGEEPRDYDEQIALMDRIPHLPPPQRANAVRIDRYSLYHQHYRDFGWARLEPFWEYRSLHPHLDPKALADIAYHFVGIGGVSSDSYLSGFEASVARWQERHDRNEGLFLHPAEGLVRNGKDSGTRITGGPLLERILALSHRVVPIPRVLSQARCERPLLEQLARDGILFIEGDEVLNLAVRTAPPRTVEGDS